MGAVIRAILAIIVWNMAIMENYTTALRRRAITTVLELNGIPRTHEDLRIVLTLLREFIGNYNAIFAKLGTLGGKVSGS